ncbi:MAG: uroporphyrinogen-III synthase [Aquisalinus sp.]|nr:uroporphyrinogen-III synthase [Aquisalinus sp.]
MTAVLAPMMHVCFPKVAIPDLSDDTYLVFTSANGVRAFTQNTKKRVWPVFAVGMATAREARKAGFYQLEAAGGSVQSLAELIEQKATAQAQLMHIAGSHVAGDLAGLLKERGFVYQRAVFYKAVASDRLPNKALELLRTGRISAATFFSPRTAKIFLSLVAKHKLTEVLQNVRIVVVSPAVAAVFPPELSSQVAVAKEPDQHAVIDILKSART